MSAILSGAIICPANIQPTVFELTECHTAAVCHTVCCPAAVFSATVFSPAVFSAADFSAAVFNAAVKPAVNPAAIQPAAVNPTAIQPAAVNPAAIWEAEKSTHLRNTGSGHRCLLRGQVQHHAGSQSSKPPPVGKLRTASSNSHPGSRSSSSWIGHSSRDDRRPTEEAGRHQWRKHHLCGKGEDKNAKPRYDHL